MGRAMAQTVSRRSLTAEARVRSRVSPCGICGEKSDIGTGFSQSTLVFPFNFIPPVLHYLKNENKLLIFITGLHNKPQGCDASAASTAGPFTKQKKSSGAFCSVHVKWCAFFVRTITLKILDATFQNSVARATRRLEFVHPYTTLQLLLVYLVYNNCCGVSKTDLNLKPVYWQNVLTKESTYINSEFKKQISETKRVLITIF
jgi:hypothetical protein